MQTFKKSLWTTQSLPLWLGYDSGFQRWMPFPHFSPRNHLDDIRDLMAFGRRGPLNPCWQVLPPVFMIFEVLEAPGGIPRSCTAIPSVLLGSLWKEVSSSGLQPSCVTSSLMLAPLHFMPGPWGARTLLPSHSGHLAKQGCISMPTESE